MELIEFGHYLKSLRKGKKLTIRQLEELTKVSNSYISQMERGDRRPSPNILKKLEGPLGIPYQELMVKAGYIPEGEIIYPPSSGALDEYIRSLIHLLIGDRERDFFHLIEGEFTERIGELFTKHNVNSTKEVTIGDKNGMRNDIPDQYADMILEIDNAQFKWAVLQELQDIAHEFHIRFNPAYDVGARQPRPKELSTLLLESNITYKGHPLTEDDRKLILDMLNRIYPDQKDLS
ncbi:helix-turn-helix domain-containing protein [Brevibacillus parabrevis]|uniref:helix-turn-helix domain-containing protein n=1 Tax=Brevibacillus parabrevis TaxID=54914 RepID=UPI0023801265|nr:helix-turn-helix transcriptional regulator [Brevibacillus parabrevis]WDV94205.1 helix-turn-helix transcriptional regulator [Brevibacillus parabrevis]